MSLQASAMLVKLTIKEWRPYRKDRRVTDKVDQEFHTDGTAGNYNKRLLSKAAMKPIASLITRIRAEHKRVTHPWCFDGMDILPSALYLDYTHTMRSMPELLKAAAKTTAQQLPIHIANERNRLGDLFDISDYPTEQEFIDSFNVDVAFFPVPDTGHFLVDLQQSDRDKIEHDLKQTLANTQANALRSLHDRVLYFVERVVERLSDPENVFRDSLVDNLSQLVEVLPGLNLFNDPLIDQVEQEIRTKLLISPNTLRTDLKVRRETATAAFDIVNLLKGGEADRQAA